MLGEPVVNLQLVPVAFSAANYSINTALEMINTLETTYIGDASLVDLVP